MAGGRYRLGRVLRRGGHAEVREGFVVGDGGFERRVALKRLLDGHAGDAALVRAFVDEARILSKLHHAGIVGVFDLLHGDDGVPLQVLEWIDGVDLGQLAADARAEGLVIGPELALHVTREVARALDYAHHATDADGRSLGIVHRDVSPENILISWTGDVKLADFGIALAVDRAEATAVGITKGKLPYMAPEHQRGDALDARADLFALGCVLHELVTGASPLGVRDGDRGVLTPPSLVVDRALPEDVFAIVLRATQPDRTRRYSRGAELADACERALAARGGASVESRWRQLVARLRPKAEAATPPSKRNALAELFDVPPVDAVRPPTVRAQPPTELISPPKELVRGASADTELALSAQAVRAVVPAEVARVVEPARAPVSETARVEPARAPASETARASASIDAVRTDDPAADPRIGTVLYGHRIVALLGKGGLSRVYLAEHVVLKRRSAVKILSGPSARNPRQARRLEREARAAGLLAHPNIVAVLDCGVTPDGLPFLAMEHLVGRTLKELLSTEGRMHPVRAAAIVRQIAEGLAAAHTTGIVHRDLKPSNVLVTLRDGREHVKILDFGCARVVDADPEETHLTETGQLLGTPSYAAPEQIRSPKLTSAKADLYSLGMVLYALLAGRPAFAGSTLEVLRQQLHVPPPRLPPAGGLELLVERLLAKEPDDRPADARAVITELDRLFPEQLPDERTPTASTDAGAESMVTFAPPPEVSAPAPMPALVHVAVPVMVPGPVMPRWGVAVLAVLAVVAAAITTVAVRHATRPREVVTVATPAEHTPELEPTAVRVEPRDPPTTPEPILVGVEDVPPSDRRAVPAGSPSDARVRRGAKRADAEPAIERARASITDALRARALTWTDL
ncbi:protein kinase, partial [Myxococcota bacterium]|nr:protein kinase [Myxococcota bacterium]